MFQNIYEVKNYLDLIFKSNSRVEDSFFYNKKENFIIGENEEACKVSIKNLIDIDISENYLDKIPILQADNKQLTLKLKEYFDFIYPNYNSKNIAIKNSVTGILKEEVDYENVIDYVTNFSVAENSKKSIDYMKIGTYYHMLMEKIDYTKNISIEEVKSLYKTMIENNEIENGYEKVIDINQVYNAIKNIQLNFGVDSKYFRELNFLLCTKHCDLIEGGIQNKIIVQGVIDLLIEVDGKYYIVDFKTNRNITEEQLINMYKLQLKLYSKALELERKVKISGKYLYSFYLNKLIQVL